MTATNSLIVKLCAVMEAVDHVEKHGKNREQNYDFARDVDVSAALRKELSSRKIFMTTSITNVATELYTTKSGGRGAISTVYTAHRFIDGESGETLEFTWASQGMDGQDKGVSKGATSAVKYALLKQFLIPTGDDPDEGTKPQDRPAAPRPAPPAVLQQAVGTRPPVQPSYGTQTPADCTPEARKWLFAKLHELGLDHEAALSLLGITSLKADMPDQTFDQIIQWCAIAQAKQAGRLA